MLACATPGAAIQPAAALTQWPDDTKPRFRYVGSAPTANSGSRSFWTRFADALTGRDTPDPASAVRHPHGVLARRDILWISDPGAQMLWRLNLKTAEFLALACDETLALQTPLGMTFGQNDDVFVADADAGHIVRFSADLQCVDAFGGDRLRRPTDIAWLEVLQRFVVVDAAAHALVFFNADFSYHSRIGGRGPGNGQFNFPTHATVTGEGHIYVGDVLNFRIQQFDAASHNWLGAFGSWGTAPGLFNKTKGVAVDSQGHIYVADAMQDQIFVYSDNGDFLLAFGGPGDGPGNLRMPSGIAVDEYDRIFVADSLNGRVQIFQYLAEAGTP